MLTQTPSCGVYMFENKTKGNKETRENQEDEKVRQG